jgi:hypothetical protein
VVFGAVVDLTILAEARSRLGVDQETLPLKIGPEKMVHRAMAATHRNSMFADSFCCVGFHAMEWASSQGQGEQNETVLLNPSNRGYRRHEQKSDKAPEVMSGK